MNYEKNTIKEGIKDSRMILYTILHLISTIGMIITFILTICYFFIDSLESYAYHIFGMAILFIYLTDFSVKQRKKRELFLNIMSDKWEKVIM